jgi:hypothetical protein
LLTTWRDAVAARERFRESATIATLLPASIREQALVQFDVEFLLNELLDPNSGLQRDTLLLGRVTRGTQLQLPVLLLLKSDPDVQRAAAGLPARQRDQPEWRVHRAIGSLAERDAVNASMLLEGVTADRLPMDGLRNYVSAVAEQQLR